MHEMPVVRKAVCARVLAHGRYDDSIGEPQIAERDLIEQMSHLLSLSLLHHGVSRLLYNAVARPFHPRFGNSIHE
jgi:hypothetical protein